MGLFQKFKYPEKGYLMENSAQVSVDANYSLQQPRLKQIQPLAAPSSSGSSLQQLQPLAAPSSSGSSL